MADKELYTGILLVLIMLVMSPVIVVGIVAGLVWHSLLAGWALYDAFVKWT